MKRPKCPYGKLKRPIGRRVCKRRPGRRAIGYRGTGHRVEVEVNDLSHARPVAVVDHRMLWDDGSAMDLPL